MIGAGSFPIFITVLIELMNVLLSGHAGLSSPPLAISEISLGNGFVIERRTHEPRQRHRREVGRLLA